MASEITLIDTVKMSSELNNVKFMVKQFPLTQIGHYEMKTKVTAMR